MSLRTRLNRRLGDALNATGGAISLFTNSQFRSHGVSVDLRSPLISNATRAAIFWGYYEGAERRAALRFLRADLPVIEVGASIGYLTALVARHVKPIAQLAVEANPLLIPILQRNLQLNGASGVRVVPAAIAYGDERAAFSPVADTASGKLSTSDSQQAISVPTTTLQKLLSTLPDGPFALVCDIEGAEYELFTNEPDSVRARCQLAVMELHDVVREGKAYDRPALGDRLAAQWGMRILFSDGKVWVLGR